MRAKLLKDTPDIKAGAILTTLNYNACTKDFIDNFFVSNRYQDYLFYFYDDIYSNNWTTTDEYQMYHIDLVKSQPDWFQIIENEKNL